MPDSREIIRAVQGVWMLARFNPAGMSWLNITLAGFWRSFGAAVLLAPFFAVTLAILYAGSSTSLGRIVAVEFAQYALGWIVFPAVMIFVARTLNLTDRYVGFIIAYNWSSVIQVAVFFPLTLATAYAGPSWTMEFLWLSAWAYVVIFLIFIARTALATTLATAISVVALDVMLRLVIVLAGSDLM